MSSSPAFTPQLVGQTEKTLNAILARHLASAGLTEPQWVILTLLARNDGPVDRDQFAAHVRDAAKFSPTEVQAGISKLVDGKVLTVSDSDELRITLTDAGKQLHSRIRAANMELTERLWGDLPQADLATAAQVLAAVLERANAELAAEDAGRLWAFDISDGTLTKMGA
jgi:DNA-binding MarR family transcriptional regulator